MLQRSDFGMHGINQRIMRSETQGRPVVTVTAKSIRLCWAPLWAHKPFLLSWYVGVSLCTATIHEHKKALLLFWHCLFVNTGDIQEYIEIQHFNARGANRIGLPCHVPICTKVFYWNYSCPFPIISLMDTPILNKVCNKYKWKEIYSELHALS